MSDQRASCLPDQTARLQGADLKLTKVSSDVELTQQTWDGERYIEADASKRQLEGIIAATPVLAAYPWRTNAGLIADVAKLGYIKPAVLDLTYGQGGFWTQYRPEVLVTNDLEEMSESDHHVDFLDAASFFGPDSFRTVVFDPPYKFSGTPAMGVMDERFGTGKPASESQRLACMYGGLMQAKVICEPKGHVLVKCMDQVVSGRVVWQTHLLTKVANAMGLTLVDRFDMLRTPIPQPPGRGQVHARRNYSTLLVFGKVR